MERKALPAVFAAVICVFNVLPADGEARPTSTLVSRLVPAQCLTGGVPGPCNTSGITFRTGSVRIRKLKQPGPVFKTSIGRVTLQAVSPAQTNVEARVSARLTYGPDNDPDPCPFANTQVFVSSWATSTMNCILSPQFGYYLTCVGRLHLSNLTPASCANVDTTVEDLSTEVYEAGFVGVTARLIASDGHAVGEISAGQKRPLVQAQCMTGGVPWPCVPGTSFGSGKVKLKRIRQTQLVANRIVGKVKISRVFPGRVQLEARVTADLSYGSDPDGDCPLAETQVLGSTVATSILSCRPGGGGSNCRGEFAVPDLTLRQCTDVNLVMENVRFEVYDVGGAGVPTALIARDGVKILGK